MYIYTYYTCTRHLTQPFPLALCFSSSVNDVMICNEKGARDGYFEFFTLFELPASYFLGFRRKTLRRETISQDTLPSPFPVCR